jgi:hypothetical protein
MKKWITVLGACMLAGSVLAQEGPSCQKMLADPSVPASTKRGAAAACARAKASANCDRQADERKLAGNARQDFMARCEGAPRPGARRAPTRR